MGCTEYYGDVTSFFYPSVIVIIMRIGYYNMFKEGNRQFEDIIK